MNYEKLVFKLDFDTQINLKEHIINVLSINGSTGVFDMKISSILTQKINALKETLVPEDNPDRDLRMKKNADKMKIGVQKVANKLVKGSMNNNINQYEGKKNPL